MIGYYIRYYILVISVLKYQTFSISGQSCRVIQGIARDANHAWITHGLPEVCVICQVPQIVQRSLRKWTWDLCEQIQTWALSTGLLTAHHYDTLYRQLVDDTYSQARRTA